MINGKSVLAVIPARGGSKGIPGKNLVELVGKPLLGWTVEAAKQSKYIDRLILSSDNEQIIEYAKSIDCEVPFVRPAELATDSTPGTAPIIHAIKTLEQKYDYTVLLQTTLPFKTAEDIDNCIELCHEKYNACLSVAETRKSPYWMYELTSEGRLSPILGINDVRRQDLPPTYVLNGAVYVAKTNFLLKNESYLSRETGAYVMPHSRSVDIDDEFDLKYCELLWQSGLIQKRDS